MTQNYNTCPFRAKAGEQMGRLKKIIDEEITSPIKEEIIPSSIEEETATIPKPTKSKFNTKLCKVLYKTDNKFSYDFDGYGLSDHNKTPNKTDKVEVTYEGAIGTKSFKIISYKFI
jgi:hypothetical protein